MPRLDEDTRLGGILDNLSQGFLAGVSSEWSAAPADMNGESIKAEMVDDLATKHFPMCMRNSHQKLRADHRLNHFGRLQYGLFLKVKSTTLKPACHDLNYNAAPGFGSVCRRSHHILEEVVRQDQ
jgi:DNA primase large subunit